MIRVFEVRKEKTQRAFARAKQRTEEHKREEVVSKSQHSVHFVDQNQTMVDLHSEADVQKSDGDIGGHSIVTINNNNNDTADAGKLSVQVFFWFYLNELIF